MILDRAGEVHVVDHVLGLRTGHTRYESILVGTRIGFGVFIIVDNHILSLVVIFFILGFSIQIGIVFVQAGKHIGELRAIDQGVVRIWLPMVIGQERTGILGAVFVDDDTGIGTNGQHDPTGKAYKYKKDT